jgi:CBS domain-containing protein
MAALVAEVEETVRDLASVMTTDVITVKRDTPIHAAARLMVEHGISGLPVVDDDGTLVGIISEGDLIVRQKRRERVSWWRAFFDDGERLAREYQKATGTTVGEVMTSPVISVSPVFTLDVAAAILHQCRIRRVPVVQDGKLVGIVSRGDLIKALATAPRPAVARPDIDLAAAMRARIAVEPWASSSRLSVDARNGVISLTGMVSTAAQKSALETMARSIDGCACVDNQLIVEDDVLPHRYGI